LNGFLPQLAFALEEAKAVDKVLTENNYKTKTLFGEQQDTIIPALMSGSYKIIHLAGHGVFDPDPTKPSGMVIGKNNFLTTMQLKQMSETSDLVFVNCCYQGKVDGTAEKYYQSRFKLAASIGTQLIENGVKAVIVAGWAVDDNGAKIFASEFYRNMLQGKPFGEAVRQARETIYNLNPNNNTWGAYQCYGNPYYRLKDEGLVYEEKQYVITEQAEIDLINLESDMRTGDYTVEESLALLKAISEETDKRKLRTPAITELEARIYKSLNKYDLALAKYEQLMNSMEGGYSFGAIELYCNLRSKLLKERIDKKLEQPEALESEFQQLNNSLEALILLSPTADRYSILGSSWKRRTALYLNRPTSLQQAIRQSANYYRKASQLKPSAYPYTNWITLEALLVMAKQQSWGGPACCYAEGMKASALFTAANGSGNITSATNGSLLLPQHNEIIETLTSMQQAYAHRSGNLSFEDWVALSNLRFVEWVVRATEKDDPSSLKDLQSFVTASYLEVWKKVGAAEDRLSEIQHLQLLIDALAALTSAGGEHFMVAQMRDVMGRLQQAVA
jgi:tetratricopeptide (TPR) repeat protein